MIECTLQLQQIHEQHETHAITNHTVPNSQSAVHLSDANFEFIHDKEADHDLLSPAEQRNLTQPKRYRRRVASDSSSIPSLRTPSSADVPSARTSSPPSPCEVDLHHVSTRRCNCSPYPGETC